MGHNKDKSPDKVEVFNLKNRLKTKMGLDPYGDSEGFLDPEAVAEADALIAKLCEECSGSIGGFLAQLMERWAVVRDMQEHDEEWYRLSAEMFSLSHEIKDIGSMCGYGLIAHFAESLRDYIEETELNMDAQRVIIQAHLDAMNLAHKKDIKEDEGPTATELKHLVKVAIEKYK